MGFAWESITRLRDLATNAEQPLKVGVIADKEVFSKGKLSFKATIRTITTS